jgi:hypothetical protein
MSENICEKININNDMKMYLQGKYGKCRNAILDRTNKILYYNGNMIRLYYTCGVYTLESDHGVTFVLQ